MNTAPNLKSDNDPDVDTDTSVNDSNLDFLFNPSSIAVIGASRDPNKLGAQILKNIIYHGYPGYIYPVNPKATELFNFHCYSSVKKIIEDVDLAIIAIPAEYVLEVLEECAEKGVKAVIIISAGFSEVGGEGKKREREIKRIARESGMRILGPNCLGAICTSTKLNASFAASMPKDGNVAFMSQSGAFCTAVLDWAEVSSVGFSHFVSLGNKADITELDLLQEWSGNHASAQMLDSKDVNPSVIAMYLEDIVDGRKFVEITSQITPHKPIIVLKPGRSKEAQEAISLHTGSMAGSDEVITTALKQAGCIRAEGMEEMFGLIKAFAWQPLPRGNKVAIVTNAGGPAVMTTDEIATSGLKLAKFSDSTHRLLKQRLPRTANIQDPVDVIGDALADRYADAIDAVLGEPEVDALIVLLTPQVMTQIEETAEYVGKLSRDHGKTVLAAFMGGRKVQEGIQVLNRYFIPSYSFPEQAVSVIARMCDYKRYQDYSKEKEIISRSTLIQPLQADKKMVAEQIFEKVQAEEREGLSPSEAEALASLYDIPLPTSRMVSTPSDAVDVANEIGYPVVLKIASEEITHKSDIGGVKVNLRGPKEVKRAFEQLAAVVREKLPQSTEGELNIVDNVQMQKYVKGGQQVIVGARRDSDMYEFNENNLAMEIRRKGFGHLILFGMGGIYTEVFKDVATGIAPLTKKEIEGMISETKVYKLLTGAREQKMLDVAGLVQSIQKVCQMVNDFPIIKELDLNPVFVLEDRNVVVDVKIMVSE